jgi:hypothetical protein
MEVGETGGRFKGVGWVFFLGWVSEGVGARTPADGVEIVGDRVTMRVADVAYAV